MMAADGKPRLLLAKMTPIHSPACPLHHCIQLSKSPPLHFTLYSTPPFSSLPNKHHPPIDFNPHICFTRSINTVALPPVCTESILWQLKRSRLRNMLRNTHTLVHTHITALSVNVNAWTLRTSGVSLMHLSWFSHQLTNLFIPSCQENKHVNTECIKHKNAEWFAIRFPSCVVSHVRLPVPRHKPER